MKYFNAKTISKYFYEQLTGSFTGFLIAVAASRLVSHYFATRSIKNLWGLTASKTVINKNTFNNLEWVISILIGFIVFEVMTKMVKKKIDENFPRYKLNVMRWMVRNKLNKRAKKLAASVE